MYRKQLQLTQGNEMLNKEVFSKFAQESKGSFINVSDRAPVKSVQLFSTDVMAYSKFTLAKGDGKTFISLKSTLNTQM